MIKEGIQQDFPHEILRRRGCYFFCLAKWASELMKAPFTNKELIAFYDICVRKGFMEADCFIINPAQVLNEMLIIDIGGIHRFHNVVRKNADQTPSQDIYVIFMKNDRQGHFNLSLRGHTWDPLPPDRVAAFKYRIDSFRVIT